MNVQGAWRKGVTGKGVVITILDDGIEKIHDDLKDNYVSISLLSQRQLCEFFSKISKAII